MDQVNFTAVSGALVGDFVQQRRRLVKHRRGGLKSCSVLFMLAATLLLGKTSNTVPSTTYRLS